MTRLAIACAASVLAVSGAAQAVPCQFNDAQLTFKGTPTDQAKCLLRPVAKWGKVGPPLIQLPPTLSALIGTTPTIAVEKLSARSVVAGLPADILQHPVSRARGGEPTAPFARYFVIHDTSSPWLGDKSFPPDLDTNPQQINLNQFLGPNAVAHAFVSRTGIIHFGHDFAVPWRATKREKVIGEASKGLFLHVENIQPRRRDPSGGSKNDAIAPMPGLSAAQYDSLALLYAIASVRAKTWLVPAYHAALDEGISDAHDDPQNFSLNAFDQAVQRLVETLRTQPR